MIATQDETRERLKASDFSGYYYCNQWAFKVIAIAQPEEGNGEDLVIYQPKELAKTRTMRKFLAGEISLSVTKLFRKNNKKGVEGLVVTINPKTNKATYVVGQLSAMCGVEQTAWARSIDDFCGVVNGKPLFSYLKE